MMGLIVICGVIIVATAVYLFRSRPAPKSSLEISDADAQLLEHTVHEKLQDRLVGWTLERGPNGPLEIIATDSATERRIVLVLTQLAEAWLPMHAHGATEDANALIEDFIDGATGTSETDESDVQGWIREALAVRLHKPGSAPKGAITRPVGPLVAALVMRNVSGRPETVLREEMLSWGVDEDEAFRIAIENLSAEAEDSLTLEAIDDEDPPSAYLIAPGDPLATSYAVVLELGALLKKRFKDRQPLLYLGDEGFVAIAGEGEPEGVGALLIEGGQPLDVVRWPSQTAAA